MRTYFRCLVFVCGSLLGKVPVVSARSCFQIKHLNCPMTWKFLAFNRLVSDLCSVDKLQVVSIGDSLHEREALFKTSIEQTRVVPKSIKFREQPNLTDLIAQHKVLHSKLHSVFIKTDAVDVCVVNGTLVPFTHTRPKYIRK